VVNAQTDSGGREVIAGKCKVRVIHPQTPARRKAAEVNKREFSAAYDDEVEGRVGEKNLMSQGLEVKK